MIEFQAHYEKEIFPNIFRFNLDMSYYLKVSGSKDLLSDSSFLGSIILVNGRKFKVLSLEGGSDEPWITTCQYLPDTKSLDDWCVEAYQTAKSKGWYEGDLPRPLERHMLMVSEVAEASEEVRNGKPPIYKVSGDGRMRVEVTPEHHMWDEVKSFKPEGEAIELVDCVIRIMDYFGYKNWSLEEAIRMKHEYNKTRAYKHGGKSL